MTDDAGPHVSRPRGTAATTRAALPEGSNAWTRASVWGQRTDFSQDREPSGLLRTLQGMRQMGETDEDLWHKCIAGDADAFGVLFDRHADAVFRYCLSRCGSWHDAEELVSITFLEAWRQRNRLRPERNSLLPWLLGVATNANRNRARGSRRHAEFLSRLPHSRPTERRTRSRPCGVCGLEARRRACRP